MENLSAISSHSYSSLVSLLVKSLIHDPVQALYWNRQTHKAIFQHGSQPNQASEFSCGSLLHEKIIGLNQLGHSTVGAKLEDLYDHLSGYPEELWEDGLKLLCLLSDGNQFNRVALHTIGEDCRYFPSKPSTEDTKNDKGYPPSFIPSVFDCGTFNYADPDPCVYARAIKEIGKLDSTEKLVELFPGLGVSDAFSNSEKNNLFGATCLTPPPFSSLLRGRFILDLPELPLLPRAFGLTTSITSSSSTLVSLEDEGYSSRPTTPAVKKIEKFVDWEAAVPGIEDFSKRVIRKINPYGLKLVRNQVDAYIDDTVFSRSVHALLMGLQSEVFSYSVEKKTFVFPLRLSVHGVRVTIFQRFSKTIISVGNLVRELNEALERAKYSPGSVSAAFWISLKKQIDVLSSARPDYESCKSLITFLSFASSVRDTFKLFCYLAKLSNSDDGSAIRLLSEISQATSLLTTNEHLKAGLELLVSSCEPFLRLLGAWLYGQTDYYHEDLNFDYSLPVEPFISLTILSSVKKIGENLELLRKVSPNHPLVERNQAVPEMLVATSEVALAESAETIGVFLDKHVAVFNVNLSLEEAWSHELEELARKTRIDFFEKACEQKRLNEELLKKKKAKDFEELKKAMSEELERKQQEKDNYLRNPYDGESFTGTKPRYSTPVKQNVVHPYLDNADKINANIDTEGNAVMPTPLLEDNSAGSEGSLVNEVLDVTSDVSIQQSFVSFCENDETKDVPFLSVLESEPETSLDLEASASPDLGELVESDLKGSEERDVITLFNRCNKKLSLEEVTHFRAQLPAPYTLCLEPEVLGFASRSEKTICVEDFRNIFINASDMIERSVVPHVHAQSRLVNRALLNSVIVEHRLDEHIRGLRRFFLLSDGEFAAALSEVVHQEGPWNSGESILSLTSSLKYVLSQSIHGQSLVAKHLTLRVHTDGQFIELAYRTPWPISLVITDDIMGKYTKVNQLLLDLRHKSSAMDKGLWRIFKAGRISKDSKSLAVVASSVREASHVLNAIRRYFHCQAIEIGWSSLNSDWKRVKTLEDVFQAHARYVDGVLNRCLLLESASTIKKVVDQVSLACVDVVQTALSYLEAQQENELKFMDSFRRFRDATKVLCIVVKCAASHHKSSYLAMFDLEVDFNNFFKSLKV